MAQETVVKLGITRYDTHSKTSGISGIGVPAGADAVTGDATTVILVIERTLTPNDRFGARAGRPAQDQGAGRGHLAPSW